MQEFSSRGFQVRQTKKALTTFFFSLVLSLFYRSQMVNFKEIYHFSRLQMGSNIFQEGSNFFQGGGSNCLFPIETHITFRFSRGWSGPPVPPPPPLDPHLVINSDWVYNQTCRLSNVIQGFHRLEKYLNIGFLEKSLKIKYAIRPWKILEFYYFLYRPKSV